MSVGRPEWPGLDVVEVSESTNADVIQRAQNGAPDGTALRALRQSGGKGRDGRVWDSPVGNVYLSILKRPQVERARWPELSFVVAVAVAEALDAHTEKRIGVKWPNDLLLEGRKVSGILLETAGDDAIVIGIGVNVLVAPDDSQVRTPSIALDPQGEDDLPERLTYRILQAFDAWFQRWEGMGFEPVRTRWVSMAEGLGQVIEVATGQGRELGRFVGIDEDGALLLVQEETRRRVLAGDVILRPLGESG